MSRISPIQTRYADCHFRSRLEARWAVFFDSLGIPWQYEPEGFNLGEAGAYLPDFLIRPNTADALWFEVKGRFPTEDEIRKAQALSVGTGIRSCVYFGPIGMPAPADLYELSFDQYGDREDSWRWDDETGWHTYPCGPAPWEIDLAPTAYMLFPNARTKARSGLWWWTDCEYCDKVIMKWHGQIGFCPYWGEIVPEGRVLYPSFGHASPRLRAAYTAAKSARFEFGAAGH
jgi:hypothetical protein